MLLPAVQQADLLEVESWDAQTRKNSLLNYIS